MPTLTVTDADNDADNDDLISPHSSSISVTMSWKRMPITWPDLQRKRSFRDNFFVQDPEQQLKQPGLGESWRTRGQLHDNDDDIDDDADDEI